MPYPIDEKFVIAVASSALFDLTESDRVFREQGPDAYRAFQREREAEVLGPGVAFPLIRRLLALNQYFDDAPVEVVLLSRNDPDTGLRVFNSIASRKVDISRAAFVRGRDPFRYAAAFNASLFLSANAEDVRMALEREMPAGRVFGSDFIDDETEAELRIAFDFDGVIVDDSAEKVFREGQLEMFHKSEREKADQPMSVGPLHKFFSGIAQLQRREREKEAKEKGYEPRVRTAIVTARNAPAHERVVKTLRDWGIEVDEAFFLGGIEKSRILQEFRPHIFFDDQLVHVEDAARVAPSVHVPFGVANSHPPDSGPADRHDDGNGNPPKADESED